MTGEAGSRLDRYLDELARGISGPRLANYDSNSGDRLQAAVNYFWNVALSEALYAPLNALEITLRNGIHSSASRFFGNEYWFDEPGVLIRSQPSAIQAVRDSLQRQKKDATADRIVAELSFGFWTTILSRPYHRHFWMRDNATILRSAFPHMTNRQRQRAEIFRRYNRLRLLRNRVFHFEPIWNRDDLAHRHQEMYQAIGWTSPTLQRSVELIDRFPGVLHSEKARIERTLRQHLESGALVD